MWRATEVKNFSNTLATPKWPRKLVTWRELDSACSPGAPASTIDVISKELGRPEAVLPANPSRDFRHGCHNPRGVVSTNYSLVQNNHCSSSQISSSKVSPSL